MKRFLNPTVWLIMSLFCTIPTACGEDKDEPGTPDAQESSIVGKWQKYAMVAADGSLSEGDPDEFWIFNKDGGFVNEDSGAITTRGTYTVEGSILTIISKEVDGDRRDENFTGTFKIEGQYMDYTFTEIGDDDFITYRFLKQ